MDSNVKTVLTLIDNASDSMDAYESLFRDWRQDLQTEDAEGTRAILHICMNMADVLSSSLRRASEQLKSEMEGRD